MDLCGALVFLAFVERNLMGSLHKLVLWGAIILVAGVTFYPIKPASANDIQVFKMQHRVLDYLASNPSMTFSAPEFINFHWRRNQPVATYGIHPVWTINMLDTSINTHKAAKELRLATTLEDQCQRWLSDSIDIFIASRTLIQKCSKSLDDSWEDIGNRSIPGTESDIRIFRRKYTVH